jgi:hypothetical protein
MARTASVTSALPLNGVEDAEAVHARHAQIRDHGVKVLLA